MKNEHRNFCVPKLGFLLILATLLSNFAYAQQPGQGTSVVSVGDEAAVVAPAAAPVTETPAPAVNSKAGAISAETGSVESSPAVSAIIDRLKRDESRVSVNDLTSAQDTLARLDMLLQIEKKISDIDKARQDRGGGALLPTDISKTNGFSNDSLNMPPPSFSAASMPLGASGSPMGTGEYSVSRIAGRQGKFTATLITPEGKQITVQRGDSIPGNYTVESITSSGVKVSSKSGGTKTLPLNGS